jgi:hypothetical protein
MATLTIEVPESLEPFADDFKYFVETMARKLHTNRHKGFSKNMDLNVLVNGAFNELNETVEAALSEGQFQASIEAADVANMAFLIALVCWDMNRQDFNVARVGIVRSWLPTTRRDTYTSEAAE